MKQSLKDESRSRYRSRSRDKQMPLGKTASLISDREHHHFV